MFTPIITRICSTEDDRGIYVKWTVPGRECPHYILGYIIAYKRIELDLNFSVRTLYGRNISSHVISTSHSSDEYEIKVAAIAPKNMESFVRASSGVEKIYNDSVITNTITMVPIPKVTKIVPTKSGSGLAIHWEVTNDVSKFLIEGFLIAYKIASLDTEYKNRLVPGCNSNSHVLKNLSRCTLYDVKLAAYTTTGSGGFSTPILIRTGAPRFIPKITAIYPMSDPLSIYIRWTILDRHSKKRSRGNFVPIFVASEYCEIEAAAAAAAATTTTTTIIIIIIII
ncbi:hypothetical protein KUTeg_009156 [Tegillarca granosa]|uniref:Fibronectin type-III domain-containing protein n=1 Tax=Tegillarca granosa TaxID=220873 RepID=A0ABQ9F7G4_TEGGR|nr:hypothetical protein KUTeg_009156 [Tegillarca granosa]